MIVRELDLKAVPNQQISFDRNGIRWEITLKIALTSMVAFISRDNVQLIPSGVRVCCNSPIIPFKHLSGSGNFMLLTDGEEEADYNKFGLTQFLVFIHD